MHEMERVIQVSPNCVGVIERNTSKREHVS